MTTIAKSKDITFKQKDDFFICEKVRALSQHKLVKMFRKREKRNREMGKLELEKMWKKWTAMKNKAI